MARYLTISTIAPKNMSFTKLHPEEAVNKMMDFWEKQLDQVLPGHAGSNSPAGSLRPLQRYRR